MDFLLLLFVSDVFCQVEFFSTSW